MAPKDPVAAALRRIPPFARAAVCPTKDARTVRHGPGWTLGVRTSYAHLVRRPTVKPRQCRFRMSLSHLLVGLDANVVRNTLNSLSAKGEIIQDFLNRDDLLVPRLRHPAHASGTHRKDGHRTKDEGGCVWCTRAMKVSGYKADRRPTQVILCQW